MTAVNYVTDARASRFTVQASATGVLAAMGHNPIIGIRDFSGELTFSPETLEGNGFHISIRNSSLNVQNDISDKDRREIEQLMNDQVLETAKYPEITYDVPTFAVTKMADSLYSAPLNGDLTLHGANLDHIRYLGGRSSGNSPRDASPVGARAGLFDCGGGGRWPGNRPSGGTI